MTTTIWDAHARDYDDARRRLVPCFDAFYGTVAQLVATTAKARPRVLDLGAGTGLLSEQVSAKVSLGALVVQDGSADMLALARQRLASLKPETVVSNFNDPLPAGSFDVIMSSLAIHHLEHVEKRALFKRIHASLNPGGLFVNADQIAAITHAQQSLLEATHLNTARSLGSSEEEIAASLERMKLDRCAPIAPQITWLNEAGFPEAGVFFQWFRFAVFAAWKSPGISLR